MLHPNQKTKQKADKTKWKLDQSIPIHLEIGQAATENAQLKE